MADRYPVNDDGDYYFSISGSRGDGFAIHWYRKIGMDCVTSTHRQQSVTLEELIQFLSNPTNHVYHTYSQAIKNGP